MRLIEPACHSSYQIGKLTGNLTSNIVESFLVLGEGIAGRWEVAEDGYKEQIIIPKEKRGLAAQERISTENKQKVTVQIMNLRTGESYIGRLAITGTHQVYLPIFGGLSVHLSPKRG